MVFVGGGGGNNGGRIREVELGVMFVVVGHQLVVPSYWRLEGVVLTLSHQFVARCRWNKLDKISSYRDYPTGGG